MFVIRSSRKQIAKDACIAATQARRASLRLKAAATLRADADDGVYAVDFSRALSTFAPDLRRVSEDDADAFRDALRARMSGRLPMAAWLGALRDLRRLSGLD